MANKWQLQKQDSSSRHGHVTTLSNWRILKTLNVETIWQTRSMTIAKLVILKANFQEIEVTIGIIWILIHFSILMIESSFDICIQCLLICWIWLGVFIVVIIIIVATRRFPLSCCCYKTLRDNMPMSKLKYWCTNSNRNWQKQGR